MLSLLHDNYAFLGGRLHVHVVHASSSTSNQFQASGGLDDVSAHSGSRSDNQTIKILIELQKKKFSMTCGAWPRVSGVGDSVL